MVSIKSATFVFQKILYKLFSMQKVYMLGNCWCQENQEKCPIKTLTFTFEALSENTINFPEWDYLKQLNNLT